MKNEFKTELYRAVYNHWFVISLFVGMGIAGTHFVFCVLPLNKYIYQVGAAYPLSAYGKWLGADNVSVYSSLYYFIIPILSAIPFVGTLKEDIQTGYIRNIITRVDKRKYYISKYLVTFLISGLVAVVPLLFNFALTAMVLPLLTPQANTALFPIFQYSMLGDFFYQHPFFYVVIYMILNYVFIGLLETLGLLAAFFYDRVFSVILAPFIVYLFLYSLTQITGWINLCPFAFLRPGQPIRADLFTIFVEIAVMVVVGGIYIYVSKTKEIL